MTEATPYIDRDLSWLDFNYRVLQEAKDSRVPLLDRLKFMAIYSSNLDEFFRVRVANHRNLLRIGKKTRSNLGFNPKETLYQILEQVNTQQLEFTDIFFNQLVPELKKEGIHLIRRQKMSAEQQEFIENFFNENLLPYVQPVLLIKNKIKPFLSNASLYLVLDLRDPLENEELYAIVKVPSDQMSRFIHLPGADNSEHYVIMLDDVVRHCVPWIFPGYEIIQSYSIKLTRDAELYIDDEFSGDLLDKIRQSLNKRKVGPASRLVYDRNMPKHILHYLQDAFDLSEYDLLPEGRYHNNFDFFRFPSFGKKQLLEAPLKPIEITDLEHSESIFDCISIRDRLLHPPYHSYKAVIKFFEDAAEDPNVTHIKIVQYRVADESRIMDALIKSAKRGKQVTAFIEIKARFDEEANISWGEKLSDAGVDVHYSIPGIKVHAKIASIIRIEEGKKQVYTYFSTGNFHEKTAFVYSDFGMFTKDPRLTNDSIRLFNYLESRKRHGIYFDYLGVGMFNLKPLIFQLINKEIRNARLGKKAEIILKMNSLQDVQMINKLYEAGRQGVEIKLLVRGICSLVPSMPGISENIIGRSIVDRYLEHARIFIFHNDGDPLYYMSSADFMYRNLNRRIEVMVPLFNQRIKDHLSALIQLQLQDNVKARSLNYNEVNEYVRDTNQILIRSQMETYLYVLRKENENVYA